MVVLGWAGDAVVSGGRAMNGQAQSRERAGQAWRPHYLTIPAAAQASLLGPVLTPESLRVVDTVDDVLVQVRELMQAELAAARSECALELERQRCQATGEIERERVAFMLRMSAQQAALIDALRPVLAQIALRAVRSVLNGTDPTNWYLQVMASVDESIRAEEHLQIVVAPARKAAAERAVQMWRERSGPSVSIEVLADDAMSASQLRLRNVGGTIDADLEEALATISRSVEAVTSTLNLAEMVPLPQTQWDDSDAHVAGGGSARAGDHDVDLSEVCDGA